jgi:hypothetical protein
MSNKKENLVDRFLESHNMDYFYCILADKEADRLSRLPDAVKKSFKDKITTIALNHIAQNDIPDYQVADYEMDSEVEEEEEEVFVSPPVISDNLENYPDESTDDDDDLDDDDDFDDD